MHMLKSYIVVMIAIFVVFKNISAEAKISNKKPNFNGIWQVMNTANYDLEAHSAKAALALVKKGNYLVPDPRVVALGAVGAVPEGNSVVDLEQIPYKKDALSQKIKNQQNWLDLDPEIKCYLPGVPRATYLPYPFEIIQSDESFLISYEFAGAVRNIYLKDPGAPAFDSWMGHSVGRWEGNTFVVKTDHLNDKTWFDRAGNYHSDKMVVVERFTLVESHLIIYEAVITDDKVFTRPWKISMPIYKRAEKNLQLGQFKCVEFVEELLYGKLRKSSEKL